MRQRDIKLKVKDKISYLQSSLNTSIESFLNSNTRKDRDRVIKIRSKLEVYTEILKMCNL
jgi:hypothetical protein